MGAKTSRTISSRSSNGKQGRFAWVNADRNNQPVDQAASLSHHIQMAVVTGSNDPG